VGRAGVVVLVVLVLAGLVVAADRGLHAYAERRVARELQTSLSTTGTPTVDIQGFPFLTQVATNHFRRVDVTASDVSGSDRSGRPGITVQSLQAQLYDVRTAERYRRITAGRLEGQATVGYAALDAVSTTPISYAGSDPSGAGRIKANVATRILGQALTVTVTGTLTLDEPQQELVVADPAVDIAGITLPRTVVSALAEQFLKPIPVGNLPLGVRLAGVQATSAGVVAELGGTDVVVSGG
jgi:hypothetical protein